jgi:hypothetical protein
VIYAGDSIDTKSDRDLSGGNSDGNRNTLVGLQVVSAHTINAANMRRNGRLEPRRCARRSRNKDLVPNTVPFEQHGLPWRQKRRRPLVEQPVQIDREWDEGTEIDGDLAGGKSAEDLVVVAADEGFLFARGFSDRRRNDDR